MLHGKNAVMTRRFLALRKELDLFLPMFEFFPLQLKSKGALLLEEVILGFESRYEGLACQGSGAATLVPIVPLAPTFLGIPVGSRRSGGRSVRIRDPGVPMLKLGR